MPCPHHITPQRSTVRCLICDTALGIAFLLQVCFDAPGDAGDCLIALAGTYLRIRFLPHAAAAGSRSAGKRRKADAAPAVAYRSAPGAAAAEAAATAAARGCPVLACALEAETRSVTRCVGLDVEPGDLLPARLACVPPPAGAVSGADLPSSSAAGRSNAGASAGASVRVGTGGSRHSVRAVGGAAASCSGGAAWRLQLGLTDKVTNDRQRASPWCDGPEEVRQAR